VSQTIDFGIDLGTTNSAVAVMTEDRIETIRNNDQQELTPSAVMVDQRGGISVGARAYRQAAARPESVATEFKRSMGTDRRFILGSREFSPEELSAEVLKSLRGDIQARFAQDISACVITVPAMFHQPASEATTRAARLAGITQAPLLQEPIAAALAYGSTAAGSDGYLLVYDFGGGTFDASLVQLKQGRLQVIDHAGDDYLGGKDFDELLVSYVVERLRDTYQIDEPVRGNPRRRRFYAKLKEECEQAKIRLSRQDEVSIELVGEEDDDGQTIDELIPIRRTDYSQMIEPLILRSVDVIRGLLSRNKLDSSAIRTMLMVGGPTLTPHLRTFVSAETGISLETRLDPMTVVARGAALYASSQVLQREGAASLRAGEISVDLKFPPVSDDETVMVGGRVDQAEKVQLQLMRVDGGWTSPQIPIENGTFVARVLLVPGKSNEFSISMVDERGTRLPVAPDRFTIRHGVTVEHAPLSRTIGVAVEGENEARMLPLLLHGTSLPATVRHSFYTTRALSPGQTEGINIHLLEGEASRADRNDHLGMIRIDGTSLTRPLPMGSEVEVTLSIDESRHLFVKAFISVLDSTIPLRITEHERKAPDPEVIQRQVRAEQQRLSNSPGLVDDSEAEQLRVQLHDALEQLNSRAADASFQAQQRLRTVQVKVDQAADAAEVPLLKSQIAEWLTHTEEQAEFPHATDSHRTQLALLRPEIEAAMKAGNGGQLRQKLEQLQSLYWAIRTQHRGFWIGYYQHLVERHEQMSDPTSAALIIRSGSSALEQQDFGRLRQICFQLSALLPKDDDSGFPESLADVKIRT